MALNDRDYQMLRLCDEVRNSSHDPDRQVGVVIADAAGHVLAIGTNAPPTVLSLTQAQSHEAIRQDAQWKYFIFEHAERNAIFAARDKGINLEGATMYSTLFPCADCARAIVAAGIASLIAPNRNQDETRDRKWLDHYRYAERILELAGVKVVEFDK